MPAAGASSSCTARLAQAAASLPIQSSYPAPIRATSAAGARRFTSRGVGSKTCAEAPGGTTTYTVQPGPATRRTDRRAPARWWRRQHASRQVRNPPWERHATAPNAKISDARAACAKLLQQRRCIFIAADYGLWVVGEDRRRSRRVGVRASPQSAARLTWSRRGLSNVCSVVVWRPLTVCAEWFHAARASRRSSIHAAGDPPCAESRSSAGAGDPGRRSRGGGSRPHPRV
jgi:hypothetical protein